MSRSRRGAVNHHPHWGCRLCGGGSTACRHRPAPVAPGWPALPAEPALPAAPPPPSRPQGFVYLKFSDLQAATAAQRALHGRWFAGRQIVADYQFTPVYTGFFKIS